MKKLALMPIIFLLFVGCAGLQKSNTDLAININEKYLDIRAEYIKAHDNSTPEMQEYMENKIAPKLNRARDMILNYNNVILHGSGTEEEQREVIIRILLEIERLLEVL